MKKILWLHRWFVIGDGWQHWYIKEIELIAEIESYYQIRYLLFGLFYRHKWISKNDEENKLEEIRSI